MFGEALSTYLQFVLDNAPYFYYVPGSGVSGKAYPTHEEFMKKLREFGEDGLAKALKTLAFLAQTKVYLFWKNPKRE
jgi:hypothetical protein